MYKFTDIQYFKNYIKIRFYKTICDENNNNRTKKL
jgi:hypothetical protein